MPSAFEEFELRLNSTEVTENALLSTKGFGGRGGGMCPCSTQSLKEKDILFQMCSFLH